ncbi:MAG TPA: hypothetical protein PLO33_02370 [Kouleothrix sp.]|jgi:hypothetical protein|uniref:hypothetical protein n=1 Tax=Kouleothrix sp. TaxID=2779161 RepID=UPI002CFB4806|nr:hypothetical protein [Kouleothrix sp.]HRC74491.1 hypothetical protein [Kouleothrix sp.]
MLIVLIINTIVCVLGALGGVVIASGSVISIADMNVAWAGWLLVGALLIPVMFVVSGVGAWLAHWFGPASLTIGLVALPWVYGLLFVAAMLMTFKAM